MRLMMILAALTLSACGGDETATRYGAADRVWVMQDLDGRPFSAQATLVFPGQGRISGTGPCNGFSADMTAPYPWFDATGVLSTKRACAALDQEAAYFGALQEMTEIEVLGDLLVLRGPEGREMVFKASG